MDVKVTIGGLTLAAVPQASHAVSRPGEVLGTLGGGAIQWRGGLRESLVLEGTGLSEAERTTLEGMVASGASVAFSDGLASFTVTARALTCEPLLGTALSRYRLELLVLPPLE